ncbi:hypothetical protein PHLGIDRAFT_97377 [Phlebiopsis gigantea 11061_1 CR5-6]|uniref:Importin N-terminal domain-containing protein n=1 Tax=Phlebiopsis gigantea (strain 11061_1 CR5-6) TaxID=745531 RepID=A0A0C3P447_PHLG1|nr:hypothetical protein PHLGIDRAFT_97377 [Phlebiopsis gigantea 11061_1 CR5-6]
MPPPSSHELQSVNPEELYNAICDAASQDPVKIKNAYDKLKRMLEMVGAFDTLSQITTQRNLPLPVRKQSIIQLKNSSLGHWKSRKLMTDDQRTNIKRRCLELLYEPDDVIAGCNKVILAKVARYEYPASWPTLLDDMVNIINSTMQTRYVASPQTATPEAYTALKRSLEALNAVLKEFVNIKLLGGIRSCSKIIEQVYLVLQSHYSLVAASLSAIDPSNISLPRTAEDLSLAHLIYKCLAKVACWVWPRMQGKETIAPTLASWLFEIFRSSAIQLQSLSELRINLVLALRSGAASANPVTNKSIEQLTLHIRSFGKFFRRLQQLDAKRFVALPSCSDLILYYWNKVVQATNSPSDYIDDDNTAVFPTRFLVQAMVLFKESLAQWAPVRKDGTQNEQVLPQTFVEDAVKLLVTRFIPLDPSALEKWMADPEEWVNLEEKDNELWEYELRPCGERVLMTLANQYHQFVVPLLRATFEQVLALPREDLPSILQKEALYCALGRCANKLKDAIPFDQWLSQSLLPEARSTNPSYPIVKRRIAWLIGKWVSSQCSSPNNATIWELLLHLLHDRGPGTDAVVRLTSAVALRECVDTIEFEVDVFLPFLPVTVAELLSLIAEADTMETKRRVLGTLNVVIERAGINIVPLLGVIVPPLPQLWSSAEEEWLFKGSLLETVTKLAEASQEQSRALIGIVVPLVQESFTSGAQTQLDEDALILWQAALRNTDTLDGVDGSTLFSLLPLGVTLLAENLDLLGKITSIIDSYILLDPSRVLQACAKELFMALGKGMQQAAQMNVKDMAISINMLVQLAPSSLWGEALHSSGLFAYLVKSLQEEQIPVEILTEYIYVMARIALMDKQMFHQLVSASAGPLRLSETQVWDHILDQWWRRFDNMSEPRHRKLAAMGMANLVSTGRHEVLDRLPTEICNMWLDVLGEIREGQSSESGDDAHPTLHLYWDRVPESYYRETEGTPEYKRRDACYQSDPVRTTQLTAFIAACIAQAEAACGGGAALNERYLMKADPTVLAQIQNELMGRAAGGS